MPVEFGEGKFSKMEIPSWYNHYSRCSFSMMVKWANEGLLQANDCKMLVIMVKWVYDHILISPSLTSISPSLKSISPSLMSILPTLAHLTIIEKLHRLHYLLSFWCFFTRFENRDEAEKVTFLPHILSASFLKKMWFCCII